MKIFLSRLIRARSVVLQDPNLKGILTFEYLEKRFVEESKKANMQVFEGGVFTDYSNTYKKVEGSDVCVAFIDDYWLSSTWKAIELCHAIVVCSKPCYIYSTIPSHQGLIKVIFEEYSRK